MSQRPHEVVRRFSPNQNEGSNRSFWLSTGFLGAVFDVEFDAAVKNALTHALPRQILTSTRVPAGELVRLRRASRILTIAEVDNGASTSGS